MFLCRDDSILASHIKNVPQRICKPERTHLHNRGNAWRKYHPLAPGKALKVIDIKNMKWVVRCQTNNMTFTFKHETGKKMYLVCFVSGIHCKCH